MPHIASGTYNVDPTHSNVGFEVKHMGIATVRGAFKTFAGTITASDTSLKLDGTVEVASIDTGDENRDGHLQSPDFFDVAQYPQITFSSESAQLEGESITLEGQITIKGVTKPISLAGTLAEGGEDPWGNQRVGFEVASTIDRGDFGLNWNQTLPNGNVLVANDVKLVVSVSAVKAA
ncbi:YceI family protein [Conexibacter sp. DBS9H8]|uniref:YceI family protein n=1 Tax=Conexibacter sp. DBS9H8 TaxID=2937801 RepID=UPI00200EB6A2|nr:YceI family protein [Conexibacter sp. DBS9H8]